MKNYSQDKYLYHYTKTSTVLDYILPYRRLLINSLSKTNDPREYKYRLFNIHSNISFGHNGFININDTANEIINNHCKTLAFSCDTNWSSQTNYYRGYMHPRMWAQYANKHTGVCLIIDRKKAIDSFLKLNNFGNLFYGEVTYYNRPESRKENFDSDTMHLQDSTEESIFEHLLKHYKELFFKKNIDWKDEAEFRFFILQNLNNSDDIYLDITDAICGIVIGHEYLISDKEQLIEYAKAMKFPIGQIEWRDANGFIGSTFHTPINDDGYPKEDAYLFNNIDFFAYE